MNVSIRHTEAAASLFLSFPQLELPVPMAHIQFPVAKIPHATRQMAQQFQAYYASGLVLSLFGHF